MSRSPISSTNPLYKDLDHILDLTAGIWEELRDQRLFITGGTGFFGSWLLESFTWANEILNLNASALVLTRNGKAFQKSMPHITSRPSIEFLTGDVRNFTFPEGHFSHIIHAATPSDATLNKEDPLLMFDTIVEGTRRALDFAVHCHAKKFLFTSSGAVYGRQPYHISHIPEDYSGAPDPTDPSAAYAEGKRAGEFLCTLYSRRYGIETKIARCFSFAGPYLPLDLHYAIGNFIRDGLNGGPIRVKGDGTPFRSYLYAADLAIWLWTILFKGMDTYPYNVGSEEAITITELAQKVAACFPRKIDIETLKAPDPHMTPERYVPSTERAHGLGLRQTINLREAIELTRIHHSRRSPIPTDITAENKNS